MDRTKTLQQLIQMLLAEMPAYRAQAAQFPQEDAAQRRLLRSLMNVCPPRPLSPDFLRAQDALLAAEREEEGVVDAAALPGTARNGRIALWQGDITRLAADAIVNAANSGMTGCYCPCHGCIDNAIHSAAGLQLRQKCAELMQDQDYPEPTGRAKLTAGYNLPARHVLHTVGPIVRGPLTAEHRRALADCYRACLTLAAEHNLQTVAFCCISTGEFHFPNQEAAEIAVQTVTDFLQQTTAIRKVIFNVYKDLDAALYRALLGPDRIPGPRP